MVNITINQTYVINRIINLFDLEIIIPQTTDNRHTDTKSNKIHYTSNREDFLLGENYIILIKTSFIIFE